MAKFNRASTYNRWDDTDKIFHLTNLLTGGAELLIDHTQDMTFDQLVDKLRQRYGSKDQHQMFKSQLEDRERNPNEGLQELAQHIEQLVKKAYPGVDANTIDILARDSFIKSLKSPAFQMKLKEYEPQSLSQAVVKAMKLETLYKSFEKQKEATKPRLARSTQPSEKQDRNDKGKSNGNRQFNARTSSSYNRSDNAATGQRPSPPWRNKDASPERNKEASDLRDQVRQLTSKLNELTTRVNQPPVQQTTETPYTQPYVQQHSPQQLTGSYYGQYAQQQAYPQPTFNEFQGHHQRRPPSYMSQDSPRQSPTFGQSSASYNQQNTTTTRLCYNCGSPNHFIRDCPLMHQQNAPPKEAAKEKPQASVRGVSQLDKHRGHVYVDLRINGQKYQSLLDTGCDISIIPADLVYRCNIIDTDQKVLAANSTEIPILGRTTLRAKLGEQDVEIDGLVSEHVNDIMIGIEWLQINRVIWNFAEGEITLNGTKYQLSPSKRGERPWCRRVVLAEDQTIPPRSQLDLNTKVVYDTLRATQGNEIEAWATENRELQPDVLVARTMVPDRPGNVPVRVMNTTTSSVKMSKGQPVSDLEKLSPLVPHQSAMKCSRQKDDLIEGMLSEVDPSVPRHIQEQLRDILYHYTSVFSKNEWDVGWTELVHHEIDTGDHRPIRQAMRRYPINHLQAIDQHLDDMLKQRVITPACSPWASNVVLAKKKDGTLRCCIDFRQLNDITKKDAYPLPRTDACLDAMSGSSLFSTFDMRSGYHQLAMSPESSDKTTFITRRGAFKFETMPFGLCNAGATFQRLMDLVLTGLNLDICLVYLDDIVVFSTSPEEHLDRLVQVLERLKQANLKLKPSKCKLMQKQVVFLGHIISGEGIASREDQIGRRMASADELEATTRIPRPDRLLPKIRSGLCQNSGTTQLSNEEESVIHLD